MREKRKGQELSEPGEISPLNFLYLMQASEGRIGRQSGSLS